MVTEVQSEWPRRVGRPCATDHRRRYGPRKSVEIVHVVRVGNTAGVGQRANQMIPFRVDVGRNVVRDLARVMTQSDALVKRHCAEKQRPAGGIGLLRAPEPHVVPTAGIVADGCSKARSSLRPNRYRLLTGASAYDRWSTVSAAIFTSLRRPERIGGVPPGRLHDGFDAGLVAHERHIERVARNAVLRQRHARHVVESGWCRMYSRQTIGSTT